MAIYTLNNLITIFESFATEHKQINSFGFGELWEANGKPKETGNTPVLWVFPVQTVQLENTIVYSFDFRCWDLVSKGEANENDVLSDTHQILTDFIQFIKHTTVYDFNVSGDPVMTPFTEELADDVTGWQCSIDIEVTSINNDCMIPMGELTPVTNPLNCEPVTITDGETITEVAAGGFYTCENGGGGGTADVTVNGTAYDSVSSGDTLNIPVVNSASTNVGTVNAGVNVVVPDATAVIKNSAGTTITSEAIPSGVSENIVISDDTVRNSDSSTTYSDIVQGVVKVIPDITVTAPNGSTASYPAMKNYACTLISALATQDLNDDLTPTQINRIQRQQPTKTGQTTSYRTGDDGDLEMGIGATFSTLSDNNIFGNTNRFTDETGAQTYTNNFVLDHLTGLMWYRVPITATQWNGAIDGALASTQGGFTDWALPNMNQILTICNYSVATNSLLNYSPFNIAVTTTTDRIWTSTTTPNATVNAYALQSNATFAGSGKTTTQSYIIVRQFIPADFGL